MDGRVISVNFNEREVETLEEFDEFFEERANQRDHSYSRSDEIRKAMIVYKHVMELLDELDYGIENVRPQKDLVRQAILDLHRREAD